MQITDQVATAPCTDPIQDDFRTFEARLREELNSGSGPEFCDETAETCDKADWVAGGLQKSVEKAEEFRGPETRCL